MQGLKGWKVPNAEAEYMGSPVISTATNLFNLRAGQGETIKFAMK